MQTITKVCKSLFFHKGAARFGVELLRFDRHDCGGWCDASGQKPCLGPYASGASSEQIYIIVYTYKYSGSCYGPPPKFEVIMK